MPLMTQNPYMDALGGTKASNPADYGFDGALLMTYYFDDTSSGGAWTPEEKSAFEAALSTWSAVANIRFLQVEPQPGNSIDPAAVNMWLQKQHDADIGGDTAGEFTPADFSTFGGYLSFNVDYHWTPEAMAPGGEVFESFLHEIGHALGLEHPHDTGAGTGVFPGIELVDADGNPRPPGDIQHDQGDNNLNSIPYTLMTYNDDPAAVNNSARDQGYAATPLAFDIATIQHMYGLVNNNTGDTVYKLQDAGPGTFYSTIWDTGGNDTIEYDGNGFSVIDLRYATLQDAVGGGGYLSQVVGAIGGLTIAAAGDNGQPTVVIENAIGGNGTDKIFGNEFDNHLDGRGGQDTLEGGGGDDTLTGGGDSDTFVFKDGWGSDTITDFQAGPDGDVLNLLDVGGLTSLSNLVGEDTASGLKLSVSGDSADFITLTGVLKAQFFTQNIIFTQRAQEGYLSGATVFADANGNGLLDASEASDVTDATGVFSLNAAGTLFAFGGIDTATGLPMKVRLSAPEHSIVITPLTTLLVAGANESKLLSAFGLTAGFGLTFGDPIGALLTGNTDAAKVFVTGAKVMDTVLAYGGAIASLGGNEAIAQHDAFATIGAALNNLGAGGTLNLNDGATLSGLFTTLAHQEGIDASPVAGALGAVLAASNATLDQRLATDGTNASLITDVGVVQAVIQTNHAPIAVGDVATATTGIGGTASADAAHGVLINDSDPDGDSLTVTGFSGGTHGNLVLNADGSYSYTVTDLTGPTGSHLHDVFTYGIGDGHTGVAVASLDITLNRAPIAVNDSTAVTKGATVQGNVLTNDSDPDGDAIGLTGVVGGSFGHSIAGTYGSFTLNADGSYIYAAAKGGLPSQIVPQDTFTYTIGDGHGGNTPATVSVVVLNPSQSYQAGTNTTLNGGNGQDVLDGSSGHDVLLGGNGPDVLIGGVGDTLTGGNGPDTFLFRPGFGANTITDFDVHNDAVQIAKSVFQNLADLFAHASNSAAGAVINDGAGNTITFTGVTLADLHAHQSDFHLV